MNSNIYRLKALVNEYFDEKWGSPDLLGEYPHSFT
jgi:hypothetical protein